MPGDRVQEILETHKVKTNIVLVAGAAPTLCEFVAAGIGVSLVHPLMVSGFEKRLAVRLSNRMFSSNFKFAVMPIVGMLGLSKLSCRS